MESITSLRSERFEIAFNKIHLVLKKMVKNETPHFRNLVYKGAKKFSLIKTYQEELHQFARLRNAIVHNKYDLGHYIAEPHAETVKRIEAISDIFTKPNEALSIATQKVITYNYDDRLNILIQGIHKHSYSQYPIYQDDCCIGLLTAKAIVRWMASHTFDSKVDFAEAKVGDIFNFEEQHPIAFVSKTSNIFEVEEIFADAHMKKQDLECVMITENGKRDKKPLGVITPWDLIEIDYV